MDFEIKNLKKSVVIIAREICYVIIDSNPNQYNMVRRLAGQNYPRFHIYLKQQHGRSGGGNFIFSLHLDQKQPSYEGSHAHSGEYFGPLIDEEVDRIKKHLSLQ